MVGACGRGRVKRRAFIDKRGDAGREKGVRAGVCTQTVDQNFDNAGERGQNGGVGNSKLPEDAAGDLGGAWRRGNFDDVKNAENKSFRDDDGRSVWEGGQGGARRWMGDDVGQE